MYIYVYIYISLYHNIMTITLSPSAKLDLLIVSCVLEFPLHVFESNIGREGKSQPASLKRSFAEMARFVVFMRLML